MELVYPMDKVKLLLRSLIPKPAKFPKSNSQRKKAKRSNKYNNICPLPYQVSFLAEVTTGIQFSILNFLSDLRFNFFNFLTNASSSPANMVSGNPLTLKKSSLLTKNKATGSHSESFGNPVPKSGNQYTQEKFIMSIIELNQRTATVRFFFETSFHRPQSDAQLQHLYLHLQKKNIPLCMPSSCISCSSNLANTFIYQVRSHIF